MGRAMIELLGIGVTDGGGGWLLHRVCARLFSGRVIAVVSARPEERAALLDAITARLVPSEGRVWVGGVPVMSATARRVRALVAEVHLGQPAAAGNRSVFWNALTAAAARRRRVAGFLRFPRPSERREAQEALEALGLRALADRLARDLDAEERARLALARALARGPECVVVRGADGALDTAATERFMARLGTLAARHRLLFVVGLASLALARRSADRVLVLADGALVFDGPPSALTDGSGRARLGALAGVSP
jgi:phosphonate transport system ATP-binding protein